jgi:hypothetical protein
MGIKNADDFMKIDKKATGSWDIGSAKSSQEEAYEKKLGKREYPTHVASKYRDAELYLFFAEVISLFFIIIFARVYKCIKTLRGTGEIEDDPIFRKVSDNTHDFLTSEPLLLNMTRS